MTPPELYRAWILCQDQQDRLNLIMDAWGANLHRLPNGPGLDSYRDSISNAVTTLTDNLKPYTNWLLEQHQALYSSPVAVDSWFPRSRSWHINYINNLYVCDPQRLELAIHMLRMNSQFTSNCLYFGCGKGLWKRELASFNPIICADVNPQLFDYVKEGYNQMFFDAGRMKFVTIKLKRLDGQEDASVDFVFSWETFPLLVPEEQETMLKELNRVMKPGARAMIHFADAFNSEDYAWMEQKHWAYMDRWKFIDMVRAEGFIPLKISTDDAPRSTCMLFQKSGDGNYDPVPSGYEKLDTQALDRLITLSQLPKEETQS